MPDKTIAYGLKISLGTLRVHLSRIFRKLRLDSRVKLAVLWEQAYPRSRQ
ncbi:MAG: LuxR C-terminal-related transcriptional regulator [Verrucomicrobia subdivision 3 bacterium]|nr:LuxR C-terminal-related transcriptional regulator [Limisphaerales bacterium]